MSTHHIKATLSLALLACTLTTLATTATAQAAEPPVKEIFTSHIGWDVNKTKEQAGAPQPERNLCTVLSKDECQFGAESSEPGGFLYPLGVAVNNYPASPEHGDLYVADNANRRVQVLTAAGAFVLMFGEQVNETTGGNICTAESKDACKAGVEGSQAGAFGHPAGIAVDPSTGDVYVQDQPNWRVDQYTAEGQFVAMFGREVNETNDNATPAASEAEKNLCTAASTNTCKTGIQGTPGAKEHGAFNFAQGGNTLTVAGPENLLYVADENRVQELKANGTWVNEIPVSSTVTSLAVDGKTGIMYVIYNQEPTVHEFDIATKAELPGTINIAGASYSPGMAISPAGDLAVSAGGEEKRFGDLYEASDGHLISAIHEPHNTGPDSLGFAENGDLYGVAGQEILAYAPTPIAELAGGTAACVAGAASGSSATFDCTLTGEVNPEGIAETEALFEWGKSPSLGQQTARQDVAAPETVHALLSVRPNETLFYQLAAYDQNVKAPEELTGEQRSLTTESVLPKVLGTPSVSFVTSSSAVLSGELNPENANTIYEFQYAKACLTGEACPAIAQAAGMVETTVEESAAYGPLGTTAEATALQPLTSYRYTLAAKNEKGEAAVNEAGGSTLPEGTFTTGPAPAPAASTGTASGVGATSATISGSVNPDGLPATYSFELGVYEGAATQYGDVFSGPAGTASTPTEETLPLTGLQPGTTYAYRIAIHSGYINNSNNAIEGATVLFTTTGVPAVIAVPAPLAQLPIPAIAFPKEVATTTTTPKALTNAQKLTKALRVCKKDHSGSKRAKCEKAAHGKYGPSKKSKKK